MRELISIIVPIYNVEKYLEQCIESIIHQTYKNIEIILVDDGSTDSCPQICDKYAKIDPRIKVIHKSNGGQDSARKAGIVVAMGKYIGYIDGDDWIEPDMYENLLKIINEYNVDIVESGVIDSWENTQKKRVPFFNEGCYKNETFDKLLAPKIIYSGNFFESGLSAYLVTKLFRKDIVKKYQLMPENSNNLFDDVICTFPCVMASRSIYITHNCYYHYRVRSDSTKRTIRKDIDATISRCYNDWISRFDGSKYMDNIIWQMNFFIMYLLISKAPYIFDNPLSDRYLRPYGNIEKKKRIILYGAGTVGIYLKEYIDSVSESNLIYWADRNYDHLCELYDVGNPEKILEMDYDYIVISILSAQIVKDVRTKLLSMGVPIEKILWVKQDFIDNPNELLKNVIYNGSPIINQKTKL